MTEKKLTRSEKRRKTLLERYGKAGIHEMFARYGSKGGKAQVSTKGFGTKKYIRKPKRS